MSIFSTTSTAPVRSTETKAKQEPRKLWINIGIPVKLGEKDTFINLPLALSADDLDNAIERETKKLKNSNSDEFTAIQEGKLLIADAVKKVFLGLKEGESILAENTNQELVQRLTIQFFRNGEKDLPENADEMRAGILGAMLGK